MLHTTFTKAKGANACIKSYRKMGKALGGITKYGKDTPIGLDKVLEVCGLKDTIWCFRCTVEPSKSILVEFACQCAEHVLHFHEDKYPNDKRPRLAIEAAAAAEAGRAVWAAARATAWAAEAAGAADAAGGAAWAAARGAAEAAAGAAWAAWAAAGAAEAAGGAAGVAEEKEWQTKTLLELLK